MKYCSFFYIFVVRVLHALKTFIILSKNHPEGSERTNKTKERMLRIKGKKLRFSNALVLYCWHSMEYKSIEALYGRERNSRKFCNSGRPEVKNFFKNIFFFNTCG